VNKQQFVFLKRAIFIHRPKILLKFVYVLVLNGVLEPPVKDVKFTAINLVIRTEPTEEKEKLHQ